MLTKVSSSSRWILHVFLGKNAPFYKFSLAKMPLFTSFRWGKNVPSICFNLLPSRPTTSLLFLVFSVFLVTNSSPFTFTSPHSPVASNSSCFYQPTSHKQLGMRPHKSDRDQQQHQYGVTPIIDQFCPVVTNFVQGTIFLPILPFTSCRSFLPHLDKHMVSPLNKD